MSTNKDQYRRISRSNPNADRRQARQMLAEEEDQDIVDEQDEEEQGTDTDGNREEQDTFEEDNLLEMQQRFLAKIRANTSPYPEEYVQDNTRKLRSMRTIDLSHSGVVRAMNAASDIKGSLFMDGCADTSVLNTGTEGHFVEVSRTLRTVTLVGFHNDLKKNSIPIGSGVTAVDLPSGPILLQVNEAPLVEGDGNSLLSTPQAREYSVKIDDVARRHGGLQRIQVEDRIIPLKFQQSLLYVPIRCPTEWELSKLPRLHLTSDQPWDPASLNDETAGNVVYPDPPDEEDSLFDYLRTINFAEVDIGEKISDSDVTKMLAWLDRERHDYRHICPTKTEPTRVEPELRNPDALMPNFGFIDVDKVKKTLANTTQLAVNVLRLPLHHHFKS